MKTTISARPEFNIEFSQTSIDTLRLVSEGHAERACRFASQPDGFLDVGRKHANADGFFTLRLSSEDMHVLVTLCNYSGVLGSSERLLVTRIGIMIYKAIDLADSELSTLFFEVT